MASTSLPGRLKRFAKLYGKRISLEDIEQELERTYPIHAAVLEHGGGLRIFAALRGEVDLDGSALDAGRPTKRTAEVRHRRRDRGDPLDCQRQEGLQGAAIMTQRRLDNCSPRRPTASTRRRSGDPDRARA